MRTAGPSLSQQIKALKRHLGTRLFEALLYCLVAGRAHAVPNLVSDRPGEFGERRSDSEAGVGFR